MSLTRDLRRIVLPPRRGPGRLDSLAATGAIESARGEAEPDDATETTESGIASPITEVKLADPENAGYYLVSREYWDTPRTITSSDGLFTIEYLDLKKLTARDANNDEVIFQFQEVDPATGAPYPDE